MKRSLSIAIVLFWCLMNVLLLRRQLWAPPPPIVLQSVAITDPMEDWWGIYYKGEKIGYASQQITPQSNGYFIRDSSALRLQLLGTLQAVKTQLQLTAASDWTLKEFDFQIESNEVRFKVRGKIADGKLQLETDSGGHLSKSDLPIRQRPFLPTALRPYIATQDLEPGKEHLFPTFDPSTLSQQIASVTVEGREQIRIGEKMEPALRIRQRFRGISVVSWLDAKGGTLKEESSTGFAMIRQQPEEARTLAATGSVPVDLITQTSVPVQTPIEDPGNKRFLRLKLSGFDPSQFSLNDGRQRLLGDTLEISREDPSEIRSYAIPLRERNLNSYLHPTPFLQSDHPEIRALAQRALRGETDALKAVGRLREWVYRGIAKEPTVSVPNALEVLRTRKGDCNEHTVLFNAMARAVGIPAKTVVGVVYLRGSFYYHAWSEVWLGSWVPVDSVLNQFPADVTHIKFLEGEIDRQIDILQLIGKLRIEVLEAS